MFEQAIPALVFFLMFIVGASLKNSDINNLQQQKKIIIYITLGQILLLPLAAWILILILSPTPVIAGGLMLVSLCPGGAISNIYTLLAKGNTALSVTLTTLNSVISVILLPIMMITLLPFLMTENIDIQAVLVKQSIQLFVLLLCPLLIGSLLRLYKPNWVIRTMPTLERLGGLGVFLLLLAIFIQYQEKISQQFESLITLALAFTAISMLTGVIFSRILSLKSSDKTAVIIEFPVRNLALTALIAVSVFNNSEYILFGAVFFVVQIPIMLSVITWQRLKHNR